MMYTNLYVYMAPRLYMSGKLYWRIKKNGKWTWRAATREQLRLCKCKIPCLVYCLNQEFEEEEE